MHKVWEWIKHHPLVVLLVLGGGVLLLLLSSGNTQSSAVVAGGAAGPSDTAIQAAAALQAAGLQADVSNNQTAAALEAKANDNATALAIASVQSQTAQYQSDLGAQVSIAGIQAQQNTSLAGISAQTSVQLAGIQSQVQLADIARQNTTDQINATVDLAALNLQGITSITNAQAERDIAQINAQVAIATAPYTTVQDLYTTLGSDNLTKLVYGAEGTKGSVLQLPGIQAGRTGSAGGNLFGSTIGNSSTGSVIGNLMQQWGYGFQTGAGILSL